MMPKKNFIRTRLAPTPSGFLHLGNIMSFAVTAELAAKTGAAVLLRIDDMDTARSQPEFIEDIFDSLHYLEIPWQEGPANYAEYKKKYSQLLRMNLYQDALEQLKERGQVFACNCSRTLIANNNPRGIYPGTCRNKNLPLDAEGLSWRIKTSPEKKIAVRSYKGPVITTTMPDTMRDFIVKKKDGFPAYQLASIVDDHYFGTELVVRGEDLWPSTLAQVYLSSLLDKNQFYNNTFLHHPLLMEAADRKLSKSAGATSVQFLRKQGKKPAEIFSMIAGMAGIATPVNDWQSLGEAML